LRPHGLRGELRVEILTDYPERLEQHAYFYLASPNSPEAVRRYPVDKLRRHKEVLLLKLGGCDDRNGADKLRGMLVQIPIEEAMPLEEGEYYHFQLIGMQVETESGELLGKSPELRFIVYQEEVELRSPAANIELLVSMAEQTDGKYIHPEELTDFLDELSREDLHLEIERLIRYRLWDNWFFLLLYVAALSAEWIIRRLRGLV